jgi:ubiquinone/menaquinone biosynthesis C-methylase UbiE
MVQHSLTPTAAQRYYDFLGARYDWFGFYEARAKQRALELLALAPGQLVLNVGLGTGKESLAIQQKIDPQGIVFGADLSPVMLRAARGRRLQALCQADGRWLPFAERSFDRLLSTYVLDLIPTKDLPGMLSGYRRLLKPGGRLVLLSLTEGVNRTSRGFVRLWKAAYAISPVVCGGCRPLQLTPLVEQCGLTVLQREVVVQCGVPSELIAAIR